MNIGIVTVAYNGYGKFITAWLKSVSELKVRPNQVTIVLGEGHKAPPSQELLQMYDLPLLIVETKEKPTIGRMRNIAVRNTLTDWIQYISVDDLILPDALNHYQEVQEGADVLCIQWLSEGLGQKQVLHSSPTPRQMYNTLRKRRSAGFLVAHSPFKRALWKARPFKEHNYPNYLFWADCLEQGAVFRRVNHPCTIYKRRPDSHARTVLIQPLEKKKARRTKRNWHNRIRRYYGKPRRVLEEDSTGPKSS